jgi:predicted nucleic acid-binding protein
MSGVEKVFLDTNVLVYAHDRNEPIKGPKAQSLLLQILAVAVHNGAKYVFSEDFQDGRVMDGVTFVNPFATSFDLAKILPP